MLVNDMMTLQFGEQARLGNDRQGKDDLGLFKRSAGLENGVFNRLYQVRLGYVYL